MDDPDHSGLIPADPFLLFGQMTTADPTRSPAGTEAVWAYTHVPQHVRGDAGAQGITGRWDDNDSQRMADRMQQESSTPRPGSATASWPAVLAPPDLQDGDANLVGGALNGGTAALHQQLIFRPIPGLGRPETPIQGLYLGPRPPTPAAACTAPAARTPPEPRSLTIGSTPKIASFGAVEGPWTTPRGLAAAERVHVTGLRWPRGAGWHTPLRHTSGKLMARR